MARTDMVNKATTLLFEKFPATEIMFYTSSQNEIEDGKSGYKCYFEAGIGKKVCPSSYFLVFFFIFDNI